MLMPTYENLRGRITENRPSVCIASGPLGPSGNPRFYKFFWQVFSLESPLEGDAFLQHAPRLCNAQFEAEIERLLGRGISCMVYGWRRPRRDPANPWDLGNAKWSGVEFAPSWDDDIRYRSGRGWRPQMTTYTPAQAFLSEVHEINSFIDDIIACPRKSNWHWPSFYLLYVDVDRLATTLMRTEHFFDPPLTGLSAPAAIEERVEGGNAILGELGKRQKAIFQWFYRMSRHILYSADDTVLRARLDAHVHPKSGWYQEFFAEYDAGTLSVDGKTLTRTVLPVLAEPPHERVDSFTASCMLRRQTFDLSTPAEQMALAHATRQAAARLGEIAARMQAYLLGHCKLEDLLYPCSA